MPTYEYACRACGHRFETVQSMKDEPLTVCPECGGLDESPHSAEVCPRCGAEMPEAEG